MTLYVRQQKRYRCKEHTFGLWEKARVGWFERIALKHVYYHTEMDHQSKLDAWNRVLRASALGHPEGWDGKGGGGEFQDRGHMYTHGWFMSMYGQKHYSIVE